jgi:integrase
MRRSKNGLPKHCGWNTDHHGRRRVRFRKDGFSTYLSGAPWSEDFMRQYAAALQGVDTRKAAIGADRSPFGSLAWLVSAYLDVAPDSSSPFKALAKATRKMRRRMLDRWRAEHGQLPLFRETGGRRVMLLTRQHVQVMVNKKVATPFEQRNFLNTLRSMFVWAVSEGRVPDNPTLGVTRPKATTGGYATWGEAEIARFEAHHPIGSKGRLAFALLLYTGQRRGDAVRMGPPHVRDGEMTITQEKTGTQLTIPVHPRLREVIDGTPTVGLRTFLVTHFGKPYTAAGFGNWFRDLANEAGCPGLSAHGLRKATATRLAEIGCGDKLIAAILGHRTDWGKCTIDLAAPSPRALVALSQRPAFYDLPPLHVLAEPIRVSLCK